MRTRFAPSPTGPLHLGHAFSALTAWDLARCAQGEFVLRIEDIDQSRSRPEWEAQIYEDLRWLGLFWPRPVMRQSERLAAYRAALQRLWSQGLLFVCTCSRRDIETALSAPQEGAIPPPGPRHGPDGPVYPGTCRERGRPHPGDPLPQEAVLRLDIARAVAGLSRLHYLETGQGPQGETGTIDITPTRLCTEIGDIVLARQGMGTSYHLSVVVDDAAQGITHIVRGQDLFAATAIHRLLQTLLDLPAPIYHHHRLLRDEEGRRLAKRDDARAIRLYRAEGLSPAALRQMVGRAAP
ncbi:MAG: tRNA glutamyl-Q(34) synthetase GluQRS [Pseudomonadota bacterium]